MQILIYDKRDRPVVRVRCFSPVQTHASHVTIFHVFTALVKLSIRDLGGAAGHPPIQLH